MFVAVFIIGVFGFKKPVQLSYASETCVPQLTLFPSIMRQVNDSGYGVTFKDAVAVDGFGIVSLRTCFNPLKAPQPGEATVAIAPWGLASAAKQFAVSVGEPPEVNAADFVGKTIPTTRPLAVSLSEPDTLFDYSLTQGDKDAACPYEDDALRCEIAALDLKQGESYEVAVVRSFGEQTETVVEGSITTLRPIKLTEQSVKADDIIYDKPTAFTFVFDKKLAEASVRLEQITGETTEVIGTTVNRDGTTLTIGLAAELPREADFRLTIEQAIADDGSALADPLVIPFKTSGGPKVVGVNVGTSSISPGGTIVLTLDQAPADA